ncbi:histidine kinase dimerization/phosphoacceptor domain -containing protein [Porphyrobacter sp. TH134]|uniref:histidine kinase dimerization/phosphoacceptor domain -containing protein n=1 Tax=Porphyrobacter sp. TH134 TaxID=2067450 RepID=UPI002D76F9CE|nr:histidine kinase dimerization/phosphoacceptor domain -containing protein [Porphyrobacter sp. TH134]
MRNGKGTITGGVVAIIDIDEQHWAKVNLEEALSVKELLLREVNHRVKNSLQLVSSFLYLEALKLGSGLIAAARR